MSRTLAREAPLSISWHLGDFAPADLEVIVRLGAESKTTDQAPEAR
jgi:hypothetical protein